MEGAGNWQDYGMRAYGPRSGRFPSADPLTKKYPWYTPYQYAGNMPIWKRDIDGLEPDDDEGKNEDREELQKRARQVELSNALQSETRDPKEELKEVEDDERDPLRSLRRLKQAASNYGRNGFNTAQSIFGGSGNITTAIDQYILRQRGLPPAPPSNPQLQNSTALEEEVRVDAALARITPGTATGQGKPIVGKWLSGTAGNAGFVPASVAQKLAGQNFKSFDDFRAAFWKAVGSTPELADQFEPSNRALMKQGLAPYPVSTQFYKGQTTYQLHHITPIQRGGQVYNVDNIMVVTPAYHQEVLSPSYHIGSSSTNSQSTNPQ